MKVYYFFLRIFISRKFIFVQFEKVNQTVGKTVHESDEN